MKNTYQPILITTIKAAAALPQYRFIGFNGNLCAVDAKALGVTSEYAVDLGEQTGVLAVGIAVVETSAAIAVGAAVGSAANGKAVTLAGAAIRNGYALDAATAAGQFIRVLLG